MSGLAGGQTSLHELRLQVRLAAADSVARGF